MKYKFTPFLILGFFAFGSLFAVALPQKTQAASFNKDLIISDIDMTASKSMSKKTIKKFLEAKGGYLAHHEVQGLDGEYKPAAKIIYNAARKYKISPKFILAHMQKESSLVTSTSGYYLDWAMGYGVCDTCSKDHPNVIKYKGFAKQIHSAASQFRNGYLYDLDTRGYTIAGWGVNIPKQALDGVTVTPKNKATACLYTYTPWIGYYGGASNHGGNSLFWDIWQDWFPYVQTKYPNGSLLQDMDSGTVYLIKNGKKLPFTSYAALVSSYNPNTIIPVMGWVLDKYDTGRRIDFPNYTLIQSPAGSIYLYVNGKKRGITSAEAFRNLGYNPEELLPLSWDDLNGIPDGELITEQDTYPVGALFQVKETGAVVYLDKKGKRHPIFSRDILENNFQYINLVPKDKAFVKSFKRGAPLKFKNGTLIATASRASVFLIDGGKRRPFKNATVFNDLGYKFENIVWTDLNTLKMHKKGKMVKKEKTGVDMSSTRNLSHIKRVEKLDIPETRSSAIPDVGEIINSN
ncbi:hypothetical protein KKC88_03870 [Patescibacteria group bacterium]|nr:hypothetical protein [Patescibacteria group bacterium]MBU1673577.1 hypothetical protein [Patescibacteria group bacterium]MBU1963479.1 hypothetical protein [Patescibacteria group bacterium]